MKRKPSDEPVEDESDILKITPLGAGNEVGRSCILIQFKNKTILLDCGLHPAYTGLAALPFIDFIDPATVDVVLVTQYLLFHIVSISIIALAYHTLQRKQHSKDRYT
jgi:cleavage and polyadenylation specificity factor subunit 3